MNYLNDLRSKINLNLINRLLLLTIIGVNLYIIGLPLAPALSLWWRGHFSHQRQDLQKLLSQPIKAGNPSAITNVTGERLVIPSILLDEDIHEGASAYTVNKGVWRFFNSAKPSEKGNTVLVGHRFTYHGPSVFYHLDLVNAGDEIALFNNGQRQLYRVTQTKVVRPNDVDILQKSSAPRLTLYTCTPMWSTKNRLVVIAERVNQ